MVAGFHDSPFAQAEAALAHLRDIANELLLLSTEEAKCAEGAAAVGNGQLASAYRSGADGYMLSHQAVLSEIAEHEAVVRRLDSLP